jgi:hypothetical protein
VKQLRLQLASVQADEALHTRLPAQEDVLDRRSWATCQELRIAIGTWIERTYHRRRRQTALCRLAPVAYEIVMTAVPGPPSRVTEPVIQTCIDPDLRASLRELWDMKVCVRVGVLVLKVKRYNVLGCVDSCAEFFHMAG